MNNKPFFTEDAVCAHECVSAYLYALEEYMHHGQYENDAEQYEANRTLRSYAKSAAKAILEHMP